MTTRKLMLKVHLWLSIPLGIIITQICLSGAILVFKNEIRFALGMPRVVGHSGKHKQVKGKTADFVQHAVKRHGTTEKPDFFTYVTRFHKSLMMGSVGKVIVTYTTIFFVIILVSGIWICWPSGKNQWRQRFRIATNRGRRRLWYDLHTTLGIYALLWLIMLTLSGIAFGLHLLPRGEVMMAFHEVHVGSWGGLLTKTITFVACLIGASLPVTGYYLYFKKHR